MGNLDMFELIDSVLKNKTIVKFWIKHFFSLSGGNQFIPTLEHFMTLKTAELHSHYWMLGLIYMLESTETE